MNFKEISKLKTRFSFSDILYKLRISWSKLPETKLAGVRV